MRIPRIAVLVPVRNGERDLSDFLDSVSRFADLVIALDDGSTDSTRAILESSPIVARVLSNPRRSSYAGWDDFDNRRRLLRALDAVDVEWVLFLDADERIDATDAAALKAFVRTEAVPGVAYGFLVVSMVDDGRGYDADSGLWVYRLFGWEPGLELQHRRLHFVPVPTSIPRRRWIRTTVRIQHFGGSDDARRRLRFQKYREADPLLEYQPDYRRLLAGPVNVRPWQPRDPSTPILHPGEARFAAVAQNLAREIERPAISAVVISQDDEATIAASVHALVSQEVDQAFEVIVVSSGTDRTADVVRDRFPSVRVVRLPRPALPGEARNAGLWVANGDYVSFPGSHVVVAPGSLQARVAAHDDGWDLVTGTTINGNPSRPGWAAYFLDHSAVLPGRPSGELGIAPAHCSYARRDLESLGGFPEDRRAGEDTVVNQKLFRLGRSAYRCSEAAFVHSSPCRSVPALLRHYFGRGRAWGRIVLERAPSRRWLIRRRGRRLLSAPWHRLRAVSRNVARWAGPLRTEYRASRHLIVAAALAAGLGTWYQVLRGAPRSPARSRRSLHRDGPALGSVLVAHQGSPAARGLGILGFGTPATAVHRVVAHADRQPAGVALPAIYLRAVAATVTPGPDGTFSESLAEAQIASHLALAQAAGAVLILGIQPTRESFGQALRRFEGILHAPSVGIGIEPAWRAVATGTDAAHRRPWPGEELDEALDWLSGVVPSRPETMVLVHSVPDLEWPDDWSLRPRQGLDIVGLADVTGTPTEKRDALDRLAARAPSVGLVFDLRTDRDVFEPFEALRARPGLRIVVYR